MSRYKKSKSVVLIFALWLLISGFSAAQSPPDTECSGESDNPACQKPFFADNQKRYNYDLRASWLFNQNNVPDDSGPTVFHAGAVNSSGNPSEIEKDSVSGDTKTEYFIQNPSPAEGGSQENWGRGSVSNTDIQISDSTQGSHLMRNFLINEPYSSMCGDGQGYPSSDGSGSFSCPEDLGLPEPIKIDDVEPDPVPDQSDSDMYWSEACEFAADYGQNEPPSDGSCTGDGDSGGEEYRTDGTYINKFEPEKVSSTLWSGVHKWREIKDGLGFPPLPENTVDTCTGDGCTNSETYCTSTTTTEYYERTDGETKTVLPTSGEIPDLESYSSIGNYNNYPPPGTGNDDGFGFTYVPELEETGDLGRECTSSTIYTECGDGVVGVNCSFSMETYPGKPTNYDSTGYKVKSQGWKITYDQYTASNTGSIWGPVNSDMDWGEEGVDNVENSAGGYHAYGTPWSLPGNPENSNDPSASFNSYQIVVSGGVFYGDRTALEISDPDGPDGRTDGVIAYNDDTDEIEGSSPKFLSRSLTAGTTASELVEKPDVKSTLSCSSTDRCLAAIDIETKKTGWVSPGNSFEIEYSSSGTHSVRDSAGACETYSELSNLPEEELDCSPGPNFDVCGAYEDERKIFFEGPDVAAGVDDYTAHYEACLRPQEGESTNMCVEPNRAEGTRKVDEGSVRNITPYFNDNEYQAGGNSGDQSICLNVDGDTGGEWYNLDDWQATEYVRREIGINGGSKTGALGSEEWQNHWVDEHPDQQADPDAIDPKILGQEFFGQTVKGGFSLEDNCVSNQGCATAPGFHVENPSIFNTGTPSYAPFKQGGKDDDYTVLEYDYNLTNIHNKVYTGNPGSVDHVHGAENTQDDETTDTLGPLENSRIDPEDDQWGLAPNLSYAVANNGTPYQPGKCYGENREPGSDVSKKDRVYANSIRSSLVAIKGELTRFNLSA